MQILDVNKHNSLVRKAKSNHIEEIFVKIGNTLKKIYLKDVDWFGVDGKYAYAKTDNRNYPLSLSLKDLEKKLDKEKFIRIHQSYMVDVKKIDAINLIEGTVLIKGENLPIGRSFKKNLLNHINCF